MQIQDLFQRTISRSINGVVKADETDASSVWQELDEFVVTRELDKHLRKFFSDYVHAVKHPNTPATSEKMGVWVSGFFGSGKSHFIKVLSYLLANKEHDLNGTKKRAVEFFENKIEDATLLADIKTSLTADTDVILFNIDSKADLSKGRDAILQVFLRVLNEMQGFSPDHPHIAHLERYLAANGSLTQFHDEFRSVTGKEWEKERDAYALHRDEVITALSATLEQSSDSAAKWIDTAEENFSLTVENFCKWVREYLDARGPQHRIIFLADEVGQFIGTDTHLMLSLQTITEELGTICRGRAWIVVTSQEDVDALLGNIQGSKANDFSKIQGRFRTRLSLSSSNADEVIQQRLLQKKDEVRADLEALYAEKGDILKHQLSFTNVGMTLKPYKNAEEFIKDYPFAPYQFQLVQKIFEAIRTVGATGLHLSRGERSMLDAFHSAAQQLAQSDVGTLVPLYRFYSSIESFLDTAVKRTIEQAATNPSLVLPLDQQVLETLFLIRYVTEMKGNIDNLVTLFIEEIDADRLALRRKIEESLQRLEKETLISRNGDNYFFLTDEERDIGRQIKNVELNSQEDAKALGGLLFEDVLGDKSKYRYPPNRMDFSLTRLCDDFVIGRRTDGGLVVAVVSSLAENYDEYESARCALDSTKDGGRLLMRLGNNSQLNEEIRTYLRTDKYLRNRSSGSVPESTKRIYNDLSELNRQRRERLVALAGTMLTEADYFAAGQKLLIKASAPNAALDEGLEYLVRNSFAKMGYLKRQISEPEKEIQAV
ncbi:MAG: BREX system P-loop protein BrxC, partial [Bacteroidota bacterium]